MDEEASHRKTQMEEGIYGMWKRDLHTSKEYTNVDRACTDAIKKAKAHLEFNFWGKPTTRRKVYFKYVNIRKKDEGKCVSSFEWDRCTCNGSHELFLHQIT